MRLCQQLVLSSADSPIEGGLIFFFFFFRRGIKLSRDILIRRTAVKNVPKLRRIEHRRVMKSNSQFLRGEESIPSRPENGERRKIWDIESESRLTKYRYRVICSYSRLTALNDRETICRTAEYKFDSMTGAIVANNNRNIIQG